MLDRPKIVCLCGSTRFEQAFKDANRKETLAGNIVLTVGFFGHGSDGEPTAEEKIRLDLLHKQKVKLADEILILNVDGYVGQSTKSEIEYANNLQKPIRYLES